MITTQKEGKDVRLIMRTILQNIQILYQNGEISTSTKNKMCQAAKDSLRTGDLSELHNHFKGLRYGSLFPAIVDECIQMTA